MQNLSFRICPQFAKINSAKSWIFFVTRKNRSHGIFIKSCLIFKFERSFTDIDLWKKRKSSVGNIFNWQTFAFTKMNDAWMNCSVIASAKTNSAKFTFYRTPTRKNKFPKYFPLIYIFFIKVCSLAKLLIDRKKNHLPLILSKCKRIL